MNEELRNEKEKENFLMTNYYIFAFTVINRAE